MYRISKHNACLFDRDDSFPFDFEQMEFHLVQNRKELNINVKGNGNIVFSV